MKETILILCMLFCHIVDDYYLQGWLASAKQKTYWEKNAPNNPLYKNDYIMALLEHAFSWTFMIHVPIIIYSIILGRLPNVYLFIVIFAINWLVHMITDNAKANLMKINLIQDQCIHIAQVFATWLIYVLISR